MSAKEFLKEKDLLLNSIEKNTVEHWENYYSNVPIKCIFEDLVIDINEIKRLTEENQELNKQIETLEKANKQLIYKLDRYDAIVDERDELKKQLEKCYCNRTDCSGRIKDSKQYDSLVQRVENQQKKFIEYMNKTIEELECDDVDDEEMKAYLIQRIDTFKEILQKYKTIIGVSDDKK